MILSLSAARQAAALLWFTRRYLPPDARQALRRSALGLAAGMLAIVLGVSALAAFAATAIIAAVGHDWLIPLAIAVGAAGASILCAVGSLLLIAPLMPRSRRHP